MAALIPSGVISAAAVSPGAAPTEIRVAVCGDSTVATNLDPNKPGGGWGQMLEQHFEDNVKIVNYASGGQSSKSFLDQEHKFKRAMELKPHFVFIQFGHNDGPGKGPARETDPNTTYSDNLRLMIDKARAIGAECILVTPMERRLFDKSGRVRTDLLGPYAAATRRVGEEKGVFVVDLHSRSVEIYQKLGRKAAQEKYGPDPEKDATHFNRAGAKLWADIICRELANAGPKYDALKNAIKKAVPATDSPAGGEK